MFVLVFLFSFTMSVIKHQKIGNPVKNFDKKGKIANIWNMKKGLKVKNGIRAKEYDQSGCSDAFGTIDKRSLDEYIESFSFRKFAEACEGAPWLEDCGKALSDVKEGEDVRAFFEESKKVFHDKCNPDFGLFGVRVNFIFAVISLVLASFWLFQ
jgi:hypothetical protein